MKPIHTNEYSVTDDGVQFDGYYARKLAMDGGWDLHWTSGFTQSPQCKVFSSLQQLEMFLSINGHTLKTFKKVKKYLLKGGV